MNKIRLLVLVAFLALCVTTTSARQAIAIPLGEQIINGNFSANTLTGWTVSGDTSTRLSTDTINTSGGNAGFDNFFTSSFAVIGDTTGSIAGDEDSSTSFISQTFTLPVISGTYDITISFKSAFDGDDGQNENQIDVFLTSLNATQLLSQNSIPLPNCAPSTGCTNSQLTQNPFSTTILNLPGGAYTLKFQLAENNNAQSNTAIGLDDVSVTGQINAQTASVPEPSSFLLFGFGLIGAAAYSRRRAQLQR